MDLKEKMKGFPPCYVINVKGYDDRKEYMRSNFEKLGIEKFTIFEHTKFTSPDFSYKYHGDKDVLEKLELGPTTSHLHSIKQWYETTTEEMAAFFEDDCDFSTVEKWKFKWEDYLPKMGAVWDALQLCLMHEGYGVMYPRHRAGHDHGLQCYIIKRSYAKKLIDYYFEEDGTINFKMPWKLKTDESKRFAPSVENVIYGLGIVYIHPLFNHNIHAYPSISYPLGEFPVEQELAVRSYEYVKNWWEVRGQHGNLDQLFDFDWCCRSGQGFTGVQHIY